MLRLYVPGGVAEGLVRIRGGELRHLRTLRLGRDHRLLVLDGAGGEHEVVLERIDGREALGRVVSTRTPVRESPLAITLLPALLKHDKMDWVVEKATELGVARLAPLVTRYTVPARGHVERWRRIAIAAAKQCGRTGLPEIAEPRPLGEALAAPWPGLRLIAWEDETATRLRDVTETPSAITIALGPEGGFHADEVAGARAAGFRTITLGHRILRAETAAVVATALCQHRWGDA